MKRVQNNQVVAQKILGNHREKSALQSALIMAVAVFATMLVGLTGLVA